MMTDGVPSRSRPRQRYSGDIVGGGAVSERKEKMKFELYSRVALTKDFPDDGLEAGDIATVVDYHPSMDVRKDGYSLEVFNALGETIAVIGVSESDIEVLHSDEVFHKRQLQLA